MAENSTSIDRRTFLAGAARLGPGVILGPAAISAFAATPAAADARDRGIRNEPPAPGSTRRYVTRPGFKPVGVSIRATAAFDSSGAARSYIFCAPKPARAANPASSKAPNFHPFPADATPGLMILDTAGELVWFKPISHPHRLPFNFRVQSYQGRPVLTWFEGRVHDSHGVGHYVLADTTYTRIATVHSTRFPADLHEFILTDRGAALHTAYQYVARRHRVPLVVGHAQVVDVATNHLLFDWPSHPHVPLSMSYVKDGALPYFDYFHINSIALWPGADRDLLISARNTSTVYLISRRSKRIRWRLGGKRSDFRFGRNAAFYWQHDARPRRNGAEISLFDDASHPSPERFASGKVLVLDRRQRAAVLKRRFVHHDDEFTTPSQGNVQLLPGGGHAVGWGFAPFFSVYPQSSALDPPLILDGRFPAGVASYRTFAFPWIGHPPVSELRVVARRVGATGRVRVYVSWNGATEVDRWQLNAGHREDHLHRVGVTRKRGFETVLHGAHDPQRHFAVLALSARGGVLGRSEVVALR